MTRKGTGAPPDLGFRTKWQQAISHDHAARRDETDLR